MDGEFGGVIGVPYAERAVEEGVEQLVRGIDRVEQFGGEVDGEALVGLVAEQVDGVRFERAHQDEGVGPERDRRRLHHKDRIPADKVEDLEVVVDVHEEEFLLRLLVLYLVRKVAEEQGFSVVDLIDGHTLLLRCHSITS